MAVSSSPWSDEDAQTQCWFLRNGPQRRAFPWLKERAMADTDERARNKGESASPNTKGNAPQRQGGDQARKAHEWGGGNKAGKGPVTPADKKNENSSARN